MPTFYCAERSTLGIELAERILRVHRLRSECQEAKSGSDAQTSLLYLLQEARASQRNAERAFFDHVKEHACTA